jgi:bifunctional DNA-binding transcriptional regulator/antitoxin component of YhaV-PrlF toxin-antitoxin module
MTKATVEITDKNFRITIPEAVRKQEGIVQGDIIELDIIKLVKKGKLKKD